MPLIVEDGSLVAGANTYVAVADFRAYATARGVTLPVDDTEAEVLLTKALDYLESFSSKFIGERVSRDQALSWPREDAVIEGWEWESTEIPRQVINAQLALAVEINAGEDPNNPTTNLPVVSQRVEGAVSVEYANPGTVHKVAKTSPSQTIIKTLLKNSGLFLVRA